MITKLTPAEQNAWNKKYQTTKEQQHLKPKGINVHILIGHCVNRNNYLIKLCPRGAQTCVLLLFCDRDREVNPMTLNLEGDQDIVKMYLFHHTDSKDCDLDILKMYLQTENEVSMSSRSKYIAWIEEVQK